MTSKISHIGIAVKNITASAELFSKLLGKGMDHTEEVPDQKVRTVMFRLGESSIELLQGTDPESPISKFIEKRGEGIHHLSLVVDDLEQELARLKAQGFQLVDEKPRLGADGYYVAFLHPKSTNGVLIELSQKKL